MRLLLTIIFYILLLEPQIVEAISCLVIRPGYGLVPEKCSQSAVGCRIRVSGDHVEWYEWAKLYDRNQLVCVYPGEYESLTGCQRKPSGSVRCWCGGKDDCNEAETSKSLYEAFTTNDKKLMASIIEDLNAKTDSNVEEATTTVKTVKATSSSKVHRVTMRTKIHHRPVTITTKEPTTTTRTKAYNLPQKPTHVGIEEVYDDDEDNDIDDEEDEDLLNVDEEPRPLPTESSFGFDDTFEETRKKLEQEMKEEDKRLKELLADEERELEEEEESPARQAKSFSLNAKKSRLSAAERRDRNQGSEERRNQAEEERLAEIEREEGAEKMKKLIEHSRQREQERQEADEDDSDEEEEIEKKDLEEADAAGFGFTKATSSWSSWCSVFVIIIARQVLCSNVF